ncbi:MAG: hypothetical protein H7Y09_14205 [Chitinophagaceae bacterium]|nr:hypothetical protein [Anaerolineae bacterium]
MKRLLLVLIRGALCGGLCSISLSACEAPATPFPVEIAATETMPSPIATIEPIRYALDVNTIGFIAEMDQLQAAAQVEILGTTANPADLGGRYDLVAAYGAQSGWTLSPITLHIALVIGQIEDETLSEILRASINPQIVVDNLGIPGAIAEPTDILSASTLRAQMANRGKPDGYGLAIGAAYLPGAAQIVEQWTAINIETRLLWMSNAQIFTALESGEIQIALITWTTSEERQNWVERFGAENIIDLYTLPISYLAVPGLNISFTPGGWPLAER